MATAFSFIIQNEFLSHLKKIDDVTIEWPLDNSTMTFGKITRIHSYLNQYGVTVPHNQYSMFYHHIYNPSVNMTTKYDMLMYALENPFTTDEYRRDFLAMFCKFQQIYRGFCKLAFMYKLRRAKKEPCLDLCLNELDSSSKNVLTLLVNNHRCLYSLTDIVNMFQSALANMSYMIATPTAVKDPYTNIAFPVSILYTMYFFLKLRLYHVPMLIDGFFKCEFHLDMFAMLYDNYIQDFALVNYVNTSPYVCLLDGLCSMLYDYAAINPEVNIHPEFPEKQLFDIMKPYLTVYYKSKYSRTRDLNIHYKKVLRKRLHEFFVFNPKFGTAEMVSMTGGLLFNTNHIPIRQHRISGNMFSYHSLHAARRIDEEFGENRRTIGSYQNRRLRPFATTVYMDTSSTEDEYSE